MPGNVVLPHVDLSRIEILDYLQTDVPGLNSTWFYCGKLVSCGRNSGRSLFLWSSNVT